MRDRVVEALAAARGPEPGRAHERTTWRLARAVVEQDLRLEWGLARNASRMRVQTIDALCMSIARQMPWTARMGAMPNVTEDARRLYEAAAQNTIRLLAGEDENAAAVETLLRHLDYSVTPACNLLASMLEIRDHWMPVIGIRPDLPVVRSTMERTLAAIVRSTLARLAASFAPEDLTELVALARIAAANLDSSHTASNCRDLTAAPGTDPESANIWRALAWLLVKSDGDWRATVNARQGFPARSPGKDRLERLLARLRSRHELKDALDRLQKLPDPCYSPAQWEVLAALFTLLPRAVAELRVIFGEHGVVDFTEVAQAARRALGTPENPTDLGLALGHRIEHLLIDEFQDTSRAQYALAQALTAGWDGGDGRTLFLVGDPMQSIYRFRQAEVGLFLSIREQGLGALTVEPIRLSANFRCARSIVEWANNTFSQAFPPAEDALVGAVPYSPSEPAPNAADGAGVFVHPAAEDRETERVVQLVEEAIRQRETVAVLVRARTHLLNTAALLRERGIRFRAIEIDSLGERPVVQDLLAITRALLHLADRPAWLAVLRAPWCGLTLADLEALARDGSRTVWESINTPAALSDDGAARLAGLKSVIAPALDRRGRVALRGIVEGAWVALGGPACLASEADLADAATYLDLLERESTGGDLPDLDGFIRKVGDLFAAPDPAAPETLELMTIHKAKGLEFDRVIVPGLGRRPKQDDDKLLLWSERPDGSLILAPISPRHGDDDLTYKFLSSEDRKKTRHETARLLYVACTRARNSLHLIGHVAGEKPESGSFLEVLWPAVRQYFESVRPETESLSGTVLSRPLRRLSSTWHREVPSPGTPSITAPFGRSVAAPDETAVGIVTHRFLDRIANDGIATWSEQRVRDARPLIEFALTAQKVARSELGAAAATVEQALLLTLRDERGRWILSLHQDARSEFAVAAVIDGLVQHLQIDRTFIDADGTRWIIDFKTGEPAAAGYHWPQLQQYARVMREFEDRPTRLGLYFPLCSAWVVA
jgi:ATP-dependent exoDNAse (exonuclease V) beta subunit